MAAFAVLKNGKLKFATFAPLVAICNAVLGVDYLPSGSEQVEIWTHAVGDGFVDNKGNIWTAIPEDSVDYHHLPELPDNNTVYVLIIEDPVQVRAAEVFHFRDDVDDFIAADVSVIKGGHPDEVVCFGWSADRSKAAVNVDGSVDVSYNILTRAIK